MLIVAFLLPIPAVFLLSSTISTRRREVLVHGLGYATIAVAILIVIGVFLVPGTTCRLLGGRYTRNACMHEWGGNGDGS
jgi:hypothetical protein